MMQRWREKLKYIEAGMIISALILFCGNVDIRRQPYAGSDRVYSRNHVVSRVIERMDKKEIEKMKCQEEEELKDIV